MKALNSKNFKKGDKIYLVNPWNCLFLTSRSHSIDTYNARLWVIASIGKKVLKLEDLEGFKGNQFVANQSGEFLTSNQYGVKYYAETEEDIAGVVEGLRAADNFATSTFEIVNIRF
jgi:hypothetical protein